MKYAKNSKESPALGFVQKIRRGTQLKRFQGTGIPLHE